MFLDNLCDIDLNNRNLNYDSDHINSLNIYNTFLCSRRSFLYFLFYYILTYLYYFLLIIFYHILYILLHFIKIEFFNRDIDMYNNQHAYQSQCNQQILIQGRSF
jgi:hypothetical protein